jgi:hypothetical protein
MPDVISNDDRDALAAEYVLGTLDYGERMGATNLLEVDHGFRGIVRIWERRLGELHLMVEPVEPDPKVWERIKAKVPVLAAGPAASASSAQAGTKDAKSEGAPEAASAATVASAPAAETPAAADTPPATAEIAPPTAPDGAEATVVAPLAPDAAANLMRELEEAARMVPATPAETAIVAPPPLIRRDEPVARAGPVPRPQRRWRLLALTMSLIAVALAGLIGAWRFFPEQLPPQLQAPAVLHIPVEPPPPLPKARPQPPPSFDE